MSGGAVFGLSTRPALLKPQMVTESPLWFDRTKSSRWNSGQLVLLSGTLAD